MVPFIVIPLVSVAAVIVTMTVAGVYATRPRSRVLLDAAALSAGDEDRRGDAAGRPPVPSPSPAPIEHALIHRPFTDGRLTPACTCGWYSIDGTHWRFDQHIKSIAHQEHP